MMNDNTPKASSAYQGKLTEFLKNADTLFSLDWMRHLAWEDLRHDVMSRQRTLYDYCRELQTDHWRQFVASYLRSFQSTLAEYKEQFENTFEDEDFVLSLLREREELIHQFVATKPSSWWQNVRKDDDGDSLRRFARRLYTLRQQDVEQFYELIDRLSIVTDLLCHRDHYYDMALDYTAYARLAAEQRKGENEKKKLTKPQLEEALRECKHLFWANTSWAVVYAVCVEDYGFEKNKADFERYAQSLDIQMDYECSNGTLQSAETSGKFYKHPTSEWREQHAPERVLRLLDALRLALSKNS